MERLWSWENEPIAGASAESISLAMSQLQHLTPGRARAGSDGVCGDNEVVYRTPGRARAGSDGVCGDNETYLIIVAVALIVITIIDLVSYNHAKPINVILAIVLIILIIVGVMKKSSGCMLAVVIILVILIIIWIVLLIFDLYAVLTGHEKVTTCKYDDYRIIATLFAITHVHNLQQLCRNAL
ncbi:hypothetical protein OSTOST_14263, partial [Ostertagia ostertagi]